MKPMVSNALKDHINKFTELKDPEFDNIISFYQVQEVRKKENLLQEGKICKYNYFVLKGCLRKFFVNEKGVEHTTDFAIENWWITDVMAFQQMQKTEYYIQAVEPSTVLKIDYSSQEKMLRPSLLWNAISG